MSKTICAGDLLFGTYSKSWHYVLKAESFTMKDNYTWGNGYCIDCYSLETLVFVKGWFLFDYNIGNTHLLYRDGKLA